MSGAFIFWLILGAALIVAELTTGTFYLLLFGLAAWVGAAAVYFFAVSLGVQLVLVGACAVAVALVIRRFVPRWRTVDANAGDLDVGNTVRVESVADGSHFKVAYRGSTWDAVLEDASGTSVSVGAVCTILAVRGNTLVVRSGR
jgi:membrane protein implicated in regulation of membrane protease activity